MTFFHDLWESVDRLSGAITLANWGIAISLLLGFLFTAFVIIAGNRKDQLNDVVARAQGLRIAEAQRGAAEATASAKQFESRISESDARVKTAEAAIASANAASKDAVAKVAEAQHASAEASAKAEGFRLDIARANERAAQAALELARYRAPRELTPQQQAGIGSAIRQFSPLGIDVLIVGETTEVRNISERVMDALKAGGWIIGNAGIPIGGITATGITVLTHLGSSAQEEQAANALVSALQSSGLPTGRNGAQFNDDLPAALTGTWDTKKTARIRIVIGAKE